MSPSSPPSPPPTHHSPFSLFFFLTLTFLLIPTEQVNRFCSVYCVNQQCTAWNSNTCNNCIAPFTKNAATGLCEVTAASGWTLVDQSMDAGGSIVANNTANATCGGTNPWRYRYYGNLTGTARINFKDLTGPMVPHYQLRIICWIILIDGWSATDRITVTLDNTQSLSVNQINKTSSQLICGTNATQDYIRFDQVYNHTAIAPYNVTVTTNNTSLKWGVKEVVVLVRNCHVACGDCWGALVSQCGSCLQEVVIYRLSGTTCNQSCLSGYGYTVADLVCVLCDLKCVTCFQTSTNCSECQSSGPNSSYLFPLNSTCLTQCPATTYPNTTDRTCYQCDPSCLSCQFNSTYCYQCDVSVVVYVWFNYQCVTGCPDLYFVDNGGRNCSTCSQLCMECFGAALNCTVCTLTGPNMAYLSGSTCVTTCPNSTYPDTAGNTLNRCLPCSPACQTCTNNPSPCLTCSPSFYFHKNQCVTTCPNDYFPDPPTQTCLSCEVYCVDVEMSMYFPGSVRDRIYVDLVFSDQLDFGVFPYQGYQGFSIGSDLYTMGMFEVSYEILSTNSYRVIIQPKGYIFLYNETITCTLIDPPTPTHTSLHSKPFKKSAYSLSKSLTWFVIKSPELSPTQKQILDKITSISDSINSLTTQPYIQELKKSGLFMFLLGGAQITSCSVLVNNVPAQNMYAGVRVWASFVFFQVPDWEQGPKYQKYFLGDKLQGRIQNARLLEQNRNRLLFDVNSIQWRFARTGHTSFFIYDTYPILLLLTVCWLLLPLTHYLSKAHPKLHKAHSPKIFTFIHKCHQIAIMYIVLNTILQWMYFDGSSVERWVSLGVAVLANCYLLLYQLYVYYDMMKYPVAHLGNQKFWYYGVRYGGYLCNIRYQEYQLSEPWSPKYWFRPYNYHILSYYKKLIMMITLPLFYHKTHAQASILILIQFAQIVRFCYIWPFCTRWRNFMRLGLEVVLLGFFCCVLVEGLLMQEIMRGDSGTLGDTVGVFYKVGWIGFGLVFVFNLSFLLLSLMDLLRNCSKSPIQQMQQIRYTYYYQKLQQYQQQNIDIPTKTINKWIRLGNLNQSNYQELPTIYLRIQYVRFCRRSGSGSGKGGGFQVEVKKLAELGMRAERDYGRDDNVVGRKYEKEFVLTRAVNRFYYVLAQELFQLYSNTSNPLTKSIAKASAATASSFTDPNTTTTPLSPLSPLTQSSPTPSSSSQTQFLTIKTFLLIDQSLYKPGESIQMQRDKMSQKIQIQTFSGERRVIKLGELILGFPISLENLGKIL